MQLGPLGEISFCNKIGHNIKSSETKEKIVQRLDNEYGIKIVRKHFEKLDHNSSLNRKTLGKLGKYPYIAGLRSNGNPYLLYLTKIAGCNQILFIDKKIQDNYFLPRIITTKMRFDEDLFVKETVFEGEMIRIDNDTWIFLIHDLMVYQGQLQKNNVIMDRINMIYDILRDKFVEDSKNLFKVQVKKYVTLDNLQELVSEFMPTLPYVCRGVYFRPLYSEILDILYNFDDSLIKDTMRVKYQKKDQFISHLDQMPAGNDYGKNQQHILPPPAIPTSQPSSPNPSSDQNIVGVGVTALQMIQEYHNKGSKGQGQWNGQWKEEKGNGQKGQGQKGKGKGEKGHGQKGKGKEGYKGTSQKGQNKGFQEESIVPLTQVMKDINAEYEVHLIEQTDNSDIYNVYDIDGDKVGTAAVPTRYISKLLTKAFEGKRFNSKLSFECKFDKSFDRWVPIKLAK
jgi:hypothetical protein